MSSFEWGSAGFEYWLDDWVVSNLATEAILLLWVSVSLSLGMDNDINLPRLLKRLNRIIHAKCLAWCLKHSRNQKCSFSHTHICISTLRERDGHNSRASSPTSAYVGHVNLSYPTFHLDLCLPGPSNSSPGRLWRGCILDGMKRMQSFHYFKILSCLRSDGQNFVGITA